jgi:hypothetical protein
MYWYHNQIHEVYRVLRIADGEYIVRADDGFLNIIKPEDCEIVIDDEACPRSEICGEDSDAL